LRLLLPHPLAGAATLRCQLAKACRRGERQSEGVFVHWLAIAAAGGIRKRLEAAPLVPADRLPKAQAFGVTSKDINVEFLDAAGGDSASN
jgi:hypothetical protein